MWASPGGLLHTLNLSSTQTHCIGICFSTRLPGDTEPGGALVQAKPVSGGGEGFGVAGGDGAGSGWDEDRNKDGTQTVLDLE